MLKISPYGADPTWVRFSRAIENLSAATKKITSGRQILDAADDPAGITRADRMRMNAASAVSANSTVQNTASALQAASNGYSDIQEYLGRINELAQRASDPLMDNEKRRIYQDEIEELITAIDRSADNTSFNDIKLLKGKDEAETQPLVLKAQIGVSGANKASVSFTPASSSYLNISTIDVSTYSGAVSAATAVTNAMSTLATAVAQNEGQYKRFDSNYSGSLANSESLQAGYGRISYANLGEGLTDFVAKLTDVKNELAGLAKEYTVTKDMVDTVILRQFGAKGSAAAPSLGGGLEGDSLGQS